MCAASTRVDYPRTGVTLAFLLLLFLLFLLLLGLLLSLSFACCCSSSSSSLVLLNNLQCIVGSSLVTVGADQRL